METREPGAIPYTYWVVQRDQAEQIDGGVIEEVLVSIFINGQELATMMCSPLDEEAMALGFLFNEGVIDSLDEVRLIKANVARTGIDIFLDRHAFNAPRRLILTSGCGGGISLQDLTEIHPALDTSFTTTPEVILQHMSDLRGESRLYNQVRGVHTSILADKGQILFSAEDVGRHNTIDKLAGKALLRGVDTHDRIMLTTGRISSDMLGKARRMGVPVVASRTSPTSITVTLAEAWNICVVGYVRQGGMRVYTHPERLGLKPIDA